MIDNEVSVQYNFTMKCNQHCTYCWHYEKINNYYEPTLENIDSAIEHLKPYKINDFILSGGELSINDKTFYIIDKAMSVLKPKRIKLLTNTYNKKFFERLKSDYDESYFYLYITLHPQFYYGKLAERYNENYLYIKDNFSDYTISILLDKRYKENIYNFYPIYKENFVGNTYFNGIRAVNSLDVGVNYVFKSNEYTDLSFYKEIADLYQINLYDKIIGWKKVPEIYKNKTCINKFFFINPDGSIKFDEQCFGKNLNNDNIYEKEYHFPFQHVICKNTYQCWRMCIYDEYVSHIL